MGRTGAYLGSSPVTCPVCRGRGGMGGYECWRCAGQGTLNTELPVEVEYPPGTRGSVARLPLTGFGIHNFYLTVHFRVLKLPAISLVTSSQPMQLLGRSKDSRRRHRFGV